jgi:hypothetical protein
MTLLSDTDRASDLTAELLTFLEASEPSRRWHRGAAFHDDIRTFDGAVPLRDISNFFRDAYPVMTPEELADPAKWVTWPIDVAVCMPASDDGADAWPPGSWAFNRMQSCGPKLARGNATLLTPRMICRDHAVITPDGDRAPIRLFYAYSGGQWVPAYDKRLRKKLFEEDSNELIGMTQTFTLMRRYSWSVCIGYDGPTIRFLTDPTGVRAAFALRDIPPGATRRAALRHWVGQHNRKKRTDPGALVEVRKHLRGATSFTWNGLRCRVEPSELDTEANTP